MGDFLSDRLMSHPAPPPPITACALHPEIKIVTEKPPKSNLMVQV